MRVRALAGCAAAMLWAVPASAADEAAVVSGYADIARAMYEDAHAAALDLQAAVAALVAEPDEARLEAARAAWLAARVPYQQTEVFRFGNAIVDDWEGRVNAWPLDEGLIDYVESGSYGSESEDNAFYVANVIANPALDFGGATIDASVITPALLAEELHEAGGVEANVATGYHAVEFLLWGQDLNGTGPGAGERPWTDYLQGEGCTGGHCDRRAAYLTVAMELLVDDLAWMAAQWGAEGAAREALVAAAPGEALGAVFTGLGSLSYGELAGERMQLGLLLNDPEEEHDCFSDNTHNSHYYNVVGMRAVYFGHYERRDGSRLERPAPAEVVAQADPAVAAALEERFDATLAAMTALKQRAETVEAYDQMLGAGNAEGNAAVQAAIDALTAQTRALERAVAALGLETLDFEGSDSLDDPAAVFQ